MLQSTRNNCVRIAIHKDGGHGRPEQYGENLGGLPDGMAFDAEGYLIVTLPMTLLARRLIKYKVSAVIDVNELKLAERRQFVKLFLDSRIHLPRELWRPTLVLLDKAHIYCPERGSGDAESTEAVIGLMNQGRKRGYAGIIATQRWSNCTRMRPPRVTT